MSSVESIPSFTFISHTAHQYKGLINVHLSNGIAFHNFFTKTSYRLQKTVEMPCRDTNSFVKQSESHA